MTKKESYLSNAYKLLTKKDYKLTIGYLGGSITYGSSAAVNGTLEDSWANLTTAWFKEQFPQATIEAVNAGVSDTATNFALFRLNACLMNTSGHDIPDVVFVEFCNNDWIYNTQSAEHLEGQIESLFRNIYDINPNAEIVIVCTARGSNSARSAYVKVAEKFNLPVVDVGMALERAIQEGGYTETAGDYQYTIDNLHPSAKGYHVYFEELKPFLEQNLLEIESLCGDLYDFKACMPHEVTPYYIHSPAIHPAGNMSMSGKAQIIDSPVTVTQFGVTPDVTQSVALTSNMVLIEGETTFETTFCGRIFGLMFDMRKADITLTYSIDDGAEKCFCINDSAFGFQRYNHVQVYMLAHDLDDGSHTLKINFAKENETVYFAGILANDSK